MEVNKIILFVSCILAISIILLIFRPWNILVDYKIRYLRDKAVEVTEALDSFNNVRVGSDFYVENVSVTVSIYKPREQQIMLYEQYSRLSAPLPRDLCEVVRGRPEKSFERFRRTSVYINHTHIKRISILTNGTLIDKRNVGKIKEYFDVIQVSLDGSRKEIHERIRGVNGSFEKTINGIRLLKEEGCYVIIAFTLNKINYQDAVDAIDFIYRLDADEIRIGLMRPYNDITRKYSISIEEAIKIYYKIIEVSKNFTNKMIIRPLFPLFHNINKYIKIKSDIIIGCGAGITKCNILPNGSITPCVYFRETAGNIRHSNFKEIWEKSNVLKKYRVMFNLNNLIQYIRENYGIDCSKCQYLKACLLGCRAFAYDMYGDPRGPNPYCLRKVIRE